MNLSNNWYSVFGKQSKKLHYLKDNLTLCGIHKTHLSSKERKGNYNIEKICKVCLHVLESYDDMNNFINHVSNSNNLRTNQKEEFVFNRNYLYSPLPYNY